MDTRTPHLLNPWTQAALDKRIINLYCAGGLGKTKTNVVVALVRPVPVTVRRTDVPRFVVPGTAADHTLVVSWPTPWKKLYQQRGLAANLRYQRGEHGQSSFAH